MTGVGIEVGVSEVSVPKGGRVALAWAAASDTGRRRASNEDSWIAKPPVYAVADGMGGHDAGDLASAAVVEQLLGAARSDWSTTDAIEGALRAATEDIAAVSGQSEHGVGTTVTGAALVLQDGDPCFAVFNIGDSRVYRLEGNELRQVTVDHSVVQELVDAGALTREQAEQHPDSNVITRAVGFASDPRPDYWMVPASAGLRLLICSDGLTKEVSDARIRLHLAAGLRPADTAGALVDAALAAGGRDNITAIVVDVVESVLGSVTFPDQGQTQPIR